MSKGKFFVYTGSSNSIFTNGKVYELVGDINQRYAFIDDQGDPNVAAMAIRIIQELT